MAFQVSQGISEARNETPKRRRTSGLGAARRLFRKSPRVAPFKGLRPGEKCGAEMQRGESRDGGWVYTGQQPGVQNGIPAGVLSEEMIVCSACKTSVSETATACPSCGATLQASLQAYRAESLTCPSCGALSAGRFCRNCGSQLQKPPSCGQCGAPLPVGSKFCGECGATVGRALDTTPKGRDYQDAGVSVPQPQMVHRPTNDQGATTSVRQPRRMGLGLKLIITMAACFVGWAIYSSSQQPSTSNDSAARPNVQPPASSDSTPLASVLPELKPREIKSSGRLPRVLRGLSLGAPYDEAKASAEPSRFPSPGVAGLVAGGRGRTTLIWSYVRGISPSDAEDFQNTVLLRLGKPDLVVWNGPDELIWVWIDGDVRMQFQNSLWRDFDPPGADFNECPTDGRAVSLTLVDWPSYSTSRFNSDPPTSEFFRRARALASSGFGASWGDTTLPSHSYEEPARELAGIQIGMEPWQVARLYPTMKIEVAPNGQFSGCLDDGPYWLCVKCWKGRVYQVSQNRAASEAAVESEGLSRLAGWFATPFNCFMGPRGRSCLSISYGEDDDVGLNDGVTEFAETWRHGKTPGVMTVVQDVAMQLAKQSAECAEHPKDYQHGPANKSLF